MALTLMAPATLCVPAIARADEAVLRAKGFFAEGKRLYNLGRFREAAGNFKKAYEAKPLALFLYNLGQCYRHMETREDLKKALFYYRGYPTGNSASGGRPGSDHRDQSFIVLSLSLSSSTI